MYLKLRYTRQDEKDVYVPALPDQETIERPSLTSQDCSRCHHRQKMPLSERVYHCPCCLLAIDRDLNAALNIRAVGLHSLGLSLEAPAFMRGE